MEEESLFLPPGFRFHPTDEEIISCYLLEKVANKSFCAIAMGEVDLNKCEPWDLPKNAKMGEKEWYFFSQKERRYPTGMRTNRATVSGYWKATGKDKEIHKGKGPLIGMKKTLVFYKGRAPKGEKTNWVMHEFRLEGNHSSYHNLHIASDDDWVVVKVFHKNEATKRNEDEASIDQNCTQSQPNPNPFFNFGYLNQDEAMVMSNQANATISSSPFIGHHKMEQFSNSVATASRDTGLSNDWNNNEISSYDDGPSSGPLFDLENIWKY